MLEILTGYKIFIFSVIIFLNYKRKRQKRKKTGKVSSKTLKKKLLQKRNKKTKFVKNVKRSFVKKNKVLAKKQT